MLICPICKTTLFVKNKSVNCENNHCFDVSKQGYINLLNSQKSSNKRHGDDKLMLLSRQKFLDKGYYNILLHTLKNYVSKYSCKNMNILDAGCGECFYSANILKDLQDKNLNILATDISKDALILASKRTKQISYIVSSVFDIPLQNLSIDMILNIFSPLAAQEYHRILKNDAILLRVIPLQKHLLSLKCKIYDSPYENKVDSYDIDGFEILENTEIKQEICINSQDDIDDLFKMTPYYYKTNKTDQQKIINLETLKTEIEFAVIVYKKI